MKLIPWTTSFTEESLDFVITWLIRNVNIATTFPL
jgi:hypothetical protein